MKYFLATILLFSYLLAQGQERTLLQTYNKPYLYYVDLNNSIAKVFEISKFVDKAGTGYLISTTDTLYKQSDDLYIGKSLKIIKENNELYLTTEFKKAKKTLIDTVQNLQVAFHNLNNAYYLGNYFRMSADLNNAYPLNHHTFRNGIHSWEVLKNKEVDYLQFRDFTVTRHKEIKDSITRLQDTYVLLTSYLIKNLKTLEYDALKDSLTNLPADYRSVSWYFGTVVNEVAKQRPECFFRLADDFPNKKSLIFIAVEENKEVIEGLKRVDTHLEIKKEFFKDRRFGKTLPYRILATYAIVGGLLTWLIVSQP